MYDCTHNGDEPSKDYVGVCLLKHYCTYNEVSAFADQTVTINQNVQNGKHKIRNYNSVVLNVGFGQHIDKKRLSEVILNV